MAYKFNKRGEVNGITLLLGAALIFLLMGGSLGGIGQSAGGAPATGSSEPKVDSTVKLVGQKCTQPTTFTLNMVRRYAEATSMTGQNATVFVNGVNRGVVSNAGTLRISDGDKVSVYYNLDPAGATYAAAKSEGTLTGCLSSVSSGNSDIFKDTVLGAAANKVYEIDSAPTVSLINLVDYTVNPTSGLSITAGDSKTVRATITYPAEEGYGVIGGSTLACRFTDSQIDQGETNAVLDGVTLGSATYVPSSTRFSLSATNQSTKFWAVPAIDGKLKTSSTLDLVITGDGTNEPTAATNFSCEMKDTDLFLNDDGVVAVGVEDSDDQSEIGRTAANEVSFNVLLA